MVFRRIMKSSFNDQESMYCMSSFIHCSKGMLFLPETCQIQVIPGFMLNRRVCQRLYCLTSDGIGGRGPTIDIFPCRTLKNCGNSSKEVLRRNLPIFVIRGSFFILKTGPSCSFCPINDACNLSASTTIVLNLMQANRLPFKPILFCRKNTGPPSSFINKVIVKKTGDRITTTSSDINVV